MYTIHHDALAQLPPADRYTALGEIAADVRAEVDQARGQLIADEIQRQSEAHGEWSAQRRTAEVLGITPQRVSQIIQQHRATQQQDDTRRREIDHGVTTSTAIPARTGLQRERLTAGVEEYVNVPEVSEDQTTEIVAAYLDALADAAHERGVTWRIEINEVLYPIHIVTGDEALEILQEAYEEVDLGEIVDAKIGE